MTVKSNILLVYSLLYTLFLWTSPIAAKNVINLTAFRDSNGKLHKRLLPDVQYQTLAKTDMRSPMGKRDAKKLPLDLLDFFSNHGGKTSKKEKRAFMMNPVSLDSQLPLLKEIEIFSSYLRNDVDTYDKLRDPNENLIILAPTNSAIIELSLKPWEFPNDIDALESKGASEMELDNAIDANINKFVRSHIVSYDDNKDDITGSGSIVLLRSLAAPSGIKDVLLKRNADSYYVASVKDEVYHRVNRIINGENGVVLIIDSCLEWPEER
ncbi:hypothetical protein NCAS_0C05250 [Naumovozyma castellii]|uniref:FAS1 domain-containing protein n=1 Tax=Naumovozyma castellii TaxID=27288 RepID=G0VDF3_NAUCA|nr:hypothetical protein NCAS_0C05250 [Naumovozyma castellii CBS 4309]CCC69515.1 hypothetical protein NCAS_0C05250 [Naumovozyma castellii CBS 4309]